jgi:two-component system sensor histidine kinase BaeS
MIPRSLSGRLVGAFAVLALALLLAVGGTLFLVLRGLHGDATLGSLADVAGSVLPQVRDTIGSGQLRGTLEEVRTQLADRNIEVMLVGADGRLRPVGAATLGTATIDTDPAVGGTVRGSVTLDGTRYLYVATTVRKAGAAAAKAIAFLAVDRSGALALGDVGRTIPIVLVVILLIAGPIAIGLSRSVTRPLQRLADATTDIPAGRSVPLPLAGPREVRELTSTFNAMAAELDSTRVREGELLANLRHDLRTPLTVITGFAAALADGTARGDAAVGAAHAIEVEAARLERLVAEIGAIDRIRSGEERIRPELLDAAEVVAATATRFGPKAGALGVTLTVASSPNLADAAGRLTMAADRVALDRMLGNLVENALAAARSSVEIEVAAAQLGENVDAVRIDVVDDGPGFADVTAARAFERFWRGDPARSGGSVAAGSGGSGSGLGLAIVKELAAAHGGEAHAENRPEGGARVGVTLPRVPWPAPRRTEPV